MDRRVEKAGSGARDTQSTLQAAMAFDLDDVMVRYARSHDLPMTIAREHERELKRFLAMSALRPESNYGMAGPVDKLWHIFLLFTQKYAEFCEVVAGRFLHHVPAGPETTGDEEEAYARFLDEYESIFNERPPHHVWPRMMGEVRSSARCRCLYCLVASE